MTDTTEFVEGDGEEKVEIELNEYDEEVDADDDGVDDKRTTKSRMGQYDNKNTLADVE